MAARRAAPDEALAAGGVWELTDPMRCFQAYAEPREWWFGFGLAIVDVGGDAEADLVVLSPAAGVDPTGPARLAVFTSFL
jgi:hypothetical protein